MTLDRSKNVVGVHEGEEGLSSSLKMFEDSSLLGIAVAIAAGSKLLFEFLPS